MPAIDGYVSLTALGTSGDFATYRGVASAEATGASATIPGQGRQVVVHTHHAPLPTQAVRDAVRRNVELLSFVHHPGISPMVECVDRPSRVALVVAAPTGPSLADVDLRSMPIVDILQCAIDVAPALAELHVHGVGHGGIDVGSLHVGAQHAQLACPWFGPVPTSPSADVAALARVLATALGRGGHRVPHGVDRVLEAATHSEPAARYRSVIGFVHDLERCCFDLRRDGLSSPFALSLGEFGLSWRDPAQPVAQAATVASIVDQLRIHDRQRPVLAVVHGAPGAGRSVLLQGVQRALREQGVESPLVRFAAVGTMPLRAPTEL
ncbi:MAG TPA: hypothetical protein DCR14_00920, partial [Acidimicrobiaceae bacterium]|nr:hypothetical protein [Acidimicrobiaceae bacterium]